MSDYRFISEVEKTDRHSFIRIELKQWASAGIYLAERLDGYRLALIDVGFELHSDEVRQRFSGLVDELGFLSSIIDVKRFIEADEACKRLFDPVTDAEKQAADKIAAKLDAGQMPF